MDNNKFFIWVWRLNGTFILCVIGFVACFILYEAANGIFRSKPQENLIVNVADDLEGEEKWELGQATHIAGTDYLFLPLESEKKEIKSRDSGALIDGSYSKRKKNTAKNILFLDTKNNEAFWLFKGTDRLILETEQFPSIYGRASNGDVTKAIFYETVMIDTDGDKLLTYDDKPSLSMSSPDGTDYVVVLKEYDKILSKSLVDEDKIIIVYQVNGLGISQLIQISPFKVISSKELPKINTLYHAQE